MENLMKDFLDKMNSIIAMNPDLMESISQRSQIKEVKKGEIILSEGEVSDNVTAVLSGMLRSFYYGNDSREITSRFTTEGEVVLSVNSFYSRRPGYEYLIADEDSVIAQISYDQQMEYLQKYIDYNIIVRVFTEKYYAASEEHLFQMRKQSAENKWKYFLDTYPHLVQRAQLQHIASFLGMSLETLSRVRALKSV